ncbi:TPA: hypothetical protein MIH92_21780 [Klebsiella pneumoniae]|nr:hypothetical protein [Klebsiella pneumoniae]HCD6837422.1 hypothetical protein [Klebsiella pneumoniae]HDH0483731.1 hypothetical protein [Klebsiella pneumoniae]HDU4737614.1 hypothetical protein [Klebsiella pneumoniae subsp. ozaenae]
MNISTVNELIQSLESAGELSKAFKQLAAENVALKQQEPKAWYIRMTDEVTTDSGEAKMWLGVPLVLAGIETPATDRIVAGIKADAIDEAAGELDRVDTVASTRVIGFKLREFAQQLREGADK